MASENDDFILCDKNQFRTSLKAPEYSLEIANEVFEFHQTIPNYKPTPFVELDNLAKKLKVAKTCVKDESKRFDLNAYKFLGVSYAVAKEILYQNEEFTWSNIVQKVSQMEQKPIFITATDGNHGYGLAYAAKILNCQAIIFMPKVFEINHGLIFHIVAATDPFPRLFSAASKFCHPQTKWRVQKMEK